MTWQPAAEQHLVRLTFTRPTSFPHFLHGSVVGGLLRLAHGEHDLPDGLIPFAPESGRIRYGAGDAYHIGITLLGEDRRHAAALKEGLRRLGQPGAGARAPLGGNFELESFTPIPPPDIDAAAQALARHEELTLCLLSPLRLIRPREFQQRGRAYLNQDCFPGRYFVERVLARLARIPGLGQPPAAKIPPLLSAEPRGLLWIDMPVPRAKTESPKGITLGGVLGRVVLRGVSAELLPALLLGGQLHVGQNVNFGFGRYTFLESEDPGDHCFRPARTLLEVASESQQLSAALDHLLSDSEAAGVDGMKPAEFALDRQGSLDALSTDLRKGKYRPDDLQGFLQPKADGNPRALAYPTARDRVAQRAAGTILGPAIDTLLEDCSYAYRKGFSREGAARAIQQAYDAGFRVVLDADIDSFFDSVDWELLFSKLDALYPFEPLLEVVRRWVQATVRFEGHIVRRERGLPQGSPISPLLANLYLDEFDEQLLGKDFRLVRYADDFVVLARDLDTVERARERSRQALDRLGLRFKESKTSIRSMDAGFSYLGYLFCRSVVTDLHKQDAPEPTTFEIAENSWLAQLPLQLVRSLSKGTKRRAFEIVPLIEQPGPTRPARKPLYILRSDCTVRVRDERLRVEAGGELLEQVPIRDVSHLVFVGRQRATLPALFRLARLDVPSFFCYRSGEVEAVFGPVEPNWRLWQMQAEVRGQPRRRLAFCRQVVAAKLHNAANLIVRFQLGAAEEAERIRELAASAGNKRQIDTLRGVEGRGAALFFGALRSSIDPLWGFEGRKRRPAPDPVNAMLSFGYTVLYRHLTTALQAQGLNPCLGLFHEPRGTFNALAADLQEEFRYLVDAFVWSLISQRRATAEDFYVGDELYGCRMQGEFLRQFVAGLETRLTTLFTPPSGIEQTYLDFMAHQTWEVAGYVSGTRQSYEPLKAHS